MEKWSGCIQWFNQSMDLWSLEMMEIDDPYSVAAGSKEEEVL